MLSHSNPGLLKIHENYRKFSRFDPTMDSEAVYFDAQYQASLAAALAGATFEEIRAELIKACVTCHTIFFYQLMAEDKEGLQAFKASFSKQLRPEDIQCRLKELQEEIAAHARIDLSRFFAETFSAEEIIWKEKTAFLQRQKNLLETLLVDKIIAGESDQAFIESLPIGTYCRLGEKCAWSPKIFHDSSKDHKPSRNSRSEELADLFKVIRSPLPSLGFR